MEKNFNNGERLDDFWVFPKLTKLEHKREYNDNVFNFLEENEDDTLTNLYIHIPFCDSGCIFCPYFKEYLNLDRDKSTFKSHRDFCF